MKQPKKFPRPFAEYGDYNTIQDQQYQPGGGEASFSEGFPIETSFLLSENGKPVSRNDMNGILNAITTHQMFMQAGGLYAYDESTDFEPPAMIWDENGRNFYVCIKANGPSTQVIHPSQDGNEIYWRPVGGGKAITDAINQKANINHKHSTNDISNLGGTYVSKGEMNVGAKTFSASARKGYYEFTTAVTRDNWGRITGISMTNTNCVDTDVDVDVDVDTDSDTDRDAGY